MTNLIPEKRLDKNGRLVTKHVRASGANIAPTSLPKVAAKSQKKQTKEDRALEKRIRHLDYRILYNFHSDRYAIEADERLKPIFQEVYSPRCTHNEFYDMLERLNVSDAIVLLTNGLKADKLDTFCKRNKFEDRLVDNREMVAELRARGIAVPVFFEMACGSDKPKSQKALIDAAECHEMYPVKTYASVYEAGRVYPMYLLNEQINLSDIKDIGVDRCADPERFRGILLKLKKGESRSTALEIGEMMDRTKSIDVDLASTGNNLLHIYGARASLAMELGAEIAEQAKNPRFIVDALDVAHENDLSHEETVAYCNFVNEVFDANEDYTDVYMLVDSFTFDIWKAGVSPEHAKAGFDQDMTVGQIIAINSENITPSVASGWL
jgi:hypothetical protein